MDAIKFLKEKNRMCNCQDKYCRDCPLEDYGCDGTKEEKFEAIVAAVEKWATEHQLKTMFDDFKEKYPNAPLNTSGTPRLCPHNLGYTKAAYCVGKCTECWNRPIEGE